MKRLLLVFMLCVAPITVHANEAVKERVVRELREDGYNDIRVGRTFLGRMRFVANKEGSRREVVVNPATGVVLRDYVAVIGNADGRSSDARASAPDEEDSGKEDGDSIEEEDDDDDDDDDSDDDDHDDDDDD
ncbi:MAG: hypothetical protein AAF222_02150 [Pseudomonadota bacterium]